MTSGEQGQAVDKAMIQVGKRVLITTNNWFYGPDGCEYRAVFGTVKSIRGDESSLGIKTNRNATNWYVEVGNMIIAGCQVFYVIHCDTPPPNDADSWTTHEGAIVVSKRPSVVFNADSRP